MPPRTGQQMDMHGFPAEFADLLGRAGQRALAGRDAALTGALAHPRTRFVARDGLLDRRQALAARALLDRALWPHLSELAAPIPPETIWGMTRNYDEWLPKTMRQRTAYLDRPRGRAFKVAAEIGLVAMLRSDSFRDFAAMIAGAGLKRRHGIQVLAYGSGDYAGPHNDHHPEMADAAQGYVDVHISLAAPGTSQQLVYAKAGHFSESVEVACNGGVTAYRLPFWHYTTPLLAKPRARDPRRWVLLGTFLYAKGNPARQT